MSSAAQIFKFSYCVNTYFFFSKIIYDFYFVVFFHFKKHLFGICYTHFCSFKFIVFFYYLFHFIFYFCQIILCKGIFRIKVIKKSIFYNRSYCHLCSGEQSLDCLCHYMCCTVS